MYTCTKSLELDFFCTLKCPLYVTYLLHICLWSKVVCFVLFVMLRSHKPQHFMPCSWLFGKLSMSRGALTWFETVWSYGVEAIDYWIIFSMKTLLEFGSILEILPIQKQFMCDQAFVLGGTEIVSVTLELLLPFYVTFVGLLNACTNRDVLEEGRFAHEQIVETGWDSFMWSFADVLVSSMHHQALQQCLLQMIMNTHLLDDKQLLAFLWTLKSVQWSIHVLFHYLMEVASFAVLYLILLASLYNCCKQRICWVSFLFYFVYCFLVLSFSVLSFFFGILCGWLKKC